MSSNTSLIAAHMLGGGGNIGMRLAKQIEHRYEVKLIEYNKATAQRLAADLDKTLVLAGDVSDEQLLQEENIADVDVYCALTNDDENNIMAHHDVVIEPEDHVIVFVVNKRMVPKVEKLFQVNVSFL